MLSCGSGAASLATGQRPRIMTTTGPAARRAIRAAAARPSGRGTSGNADANANADAAAADRKRSSKKAASKNTTKPASSSTNTAGAADVEAAAREVLYTSADLAAETIGAAAGAVEAAAEAAADAADDAVAAAAGLASSVAREAEEVASDFVFATASMADAAAAALQEAVGGAAGAGAATPSSASSSSANATGAPPPPPPRGPPSPVLSATELKRQLVQAVAGLDRGLGASLREARNVDALARRLERAAPSVEPDSDGDDANTAPPLAPGCWRLVYSSAFGGGSLGGSRPGPPAALTPLVLGGVFQVVDREKGTLDNVVELLAPGLAAPKALVAAPLKALSSALGGALGGGFNAADANENDDDDDDDDDPTPGVRLTLRHDYEILSSSSGSGSSNGGATVRIVFEDTFARALGPSFLASRLPQLALPSLPEPLRPPRGLRAATFEVTYEDREMRVTRGDRGELRVFLREPGRGLDAAPLRKGVAAGAGATTTGAAPRRAAAWTLSSMED